MEFFAVPAHDMLRLRDAVGVAWAVFDPAWYLATYPDAGVALDTYDPDAVLRFYLEHGQQQGHSPNLFFDEAWHLKTYPRAAAAVRDGRALSGFDAYCREGFHGRSPHWLFDEMRYRTLATDLDEAALQAAGAINGYDHFLRTGQREGRSGHRLFDPAFYREQFAADTALAAAAADAPFTHYVHQIAAGGTEPRTTRYFDPTWYQRTYHAALEGRSGALRHYLCNDTPCEFDPLAEFSETFYLGQHREAAAAVRAGRYRNGYAHFLAAGIQEDRVPTVAFNLAAHAAEAEVVEDIRAGRAADPFEHFLRFGPVLHPVPEPPPPPPLVEYKPPPHAAIMPETLLHTHACAALPALAWHQLDFTCREKPDLSVIMVLQGEFEAALLTLASLRQNYPGPIELVLIDSGSNDEARYLDLYAPGSRLVRFDDDIGQVVGFNAGENFVSAEVVLLVEAGMALAPGAVAAGLRRLAGDERVGVVGGKIVGANAELISAGIILWRDATAADYLHGASPLAPEANFVRRVEACSSFLLLRTALLRQPEGFDTDLRAMRYAAIDLCIRIAAAGHTVVYDPGVTVFHSPGADAPAADTQSRLTFQRKHATLLRFRYIADERVQVFARFAGKPRRRVLFIEDTVPLRMIGSGFVRSNDILRVMVSLGFQVTVLPVLPNRFERARIHADIPDQVEVMHHLTIADLDHLLAARPGYFDIVWVARAHNLNGVRSVLERTIVGTGRPPMVVLDTEAIGATRDAIRAELFGEPPIDLDAAIMAEMAQAELCQAIIVVSQREAAKLSALGFPDVAVIGHMRAPRPTPRPFAQRAGMLFVGAVHRMDSPNYDSLCWFVDDVLPLVEASLGWETRLTVIGYADASVSLERFRDHPRILLRGAVARTEPAYDQHRLFVAPTRYAAGTPYKLYEAASYGVPIVATELLADQMEWTDGEELLAAGSTDPKAFAEKIVSLYRDEALWTRLRVNALERLARDNGPEAYEAAVGAVLGSGEAPAWPLGPGRSLIASG